RDRRTARLGRPGARSPGARVLDAHASPVGGLLLRSLRRGAGDRARSVPSAGGTGGGLDSRRSPARSGRREHRHARGRLSIPRRSHRGPVRCRPACACEPRSSRLESGVCRASGVGSRVPVPTRGEVPRRLPREPRSIRVHRGGSTGLRARGHRRLGRRRADRRSSSTPRSDRRTAPGPRGLDGASCPRVADAPPRRASASSRGPRQLGRGWRALRVVASSRRRRVREVECDLNDLFDRVLVVNLLASTVVFYAAARLYVLPRLAEWTFRSIMPPILLLHAFRHLGLMFLTRGATYPGLPEQFAYPAAIGDLIAAVLAFVSLVAVVQNRRAARVLVWLFNVEGTLDLLDAIL